MNKILGIVVIGLLVYLAQVYESASCRDHVERLKLTGAEAENEYKICKSF